MSMTRIDREETVALNPRRTGDHFGQVQDTLLDLSEEVAVDVALHMESAGVRWTTAKVKVVVDLESEP